MLLSESERRLLGALERGKRVIFRNGRPAGKNFFVVYDAIGEIPVAWSVVGSLRRRRLITDTQVSGGLRMLAITPQGRDAVVEK